MNNYIGEDDKQLKQHSFVVVSDEKGVIAGLEYSMVTSVISSFKSKWQRLEKLRYKENMELPQDAMYEKKFRKASYVILSSSSFFISIIIDNL